jgi:hypothetical protein
MAKRGALFADALHKAKTTLAKSCQRIAVQKVFPDSDQEGRQQAE